MAGPKKASDEIASIAAEFAKVIGAPKKIERPPGTITAREYARAEGLNEKPAGVFLLKLYRANKAERTRIGLSYCYKLK